MTQPTRVGVELPDIPSQPTELEDAAAALYQASRFFVERNVIERDVNEVLELDVVATSYEGETPTSVIAEAKSGKWGYADLFKLYGWMRYLGINRGALFVTKAPDGKELPRVRAKIAPLGIGVIQLDSPNLVNRFTEAGFPAGADPKAIDAWRFVYAIQRTLIAYLKKYRNSNPQQVGARLALEYHSLINDQVFFEPDHRERLAQLYGAYRKHPKLALGIAQELGGKAYDGDAKDPTNARIRRAMYDGQDDILQASFFVEHRARLAILKTAIDLCLAGTAPKPRITIGANVVFNQDDFLPDTFRDGLAQLRTHKYFKLYGVFWQVFLWGFGGFYLNDRRDEEFAWISTHTGVPADQIPNALRAFDVLFPAGGSWLASPSNTRLTLVKMVPVATRGLGAYHRELHYGVTNYVDLVGKDDMTARDLSKWHNKGYTTLKLRESLKGV